MHINIAALRLENVLLRGVLARRLIASEPDSNLENRCGRDEEIRINIDKKNDCLLEGRKGHYAIENMITYARIRLLYYEPLVVNSTIKSGTKTPGQNCCNRDEKGHRKCGRIALRYHPHRRSRKSYRTPAFIQSRSTG